MLTKIFVCGVLLLVVGAEEVKNSKRNVNGLSFPSWNSVLHSWGSVPQTWTTNAFPHGSLHSISSMHLGKDASHLSLIPQHTTNDIAAAVAAAKEATAAAALAQQRVKAAREHVVIQERVAAAKEAAAQAAIQRSEAAQVAAAIQRSTTLAAAADSADSAAGHFTSGPWTNAKPAYNPWA